jgi:hypothetical protein
MANNRKIFKAKKLTPAQQTEFDTALAHNRAHQFVQAPHDVLRGVIGKRPELALKDISHLAQTCVRFYTLFQPVVDKAAIKKLLQHIAYGEQAAAEKMITACPRLLMLSGDVVDYSGRKIIDVTPLQLAFGGDDEEMCAMLKTKLSAEEFAKQIDNKFPDNAKAEQKEIEEFDVLMKQLVAGISDPHANILDEINHVPNESPLRNLLDSFRVKFAPGEVRGGKHFNPEILLKAFEIYDANYDPWDIDRLRLFWSQVIGCLERLLPVSYVQAICQGVDKVLKGEPLKRQLKLGDNITYFPLDADPANRLGFDHGVHLSGLRVERGQAPWVCSVGSRAFKTYVEQKHQACRIMRPHRKEKMSRCVVC